MTVSNWVVSWDQDRNRIEARPRQLLDRSGWTATGHEFGVTSWTCAVMAENENEAKQRAEKIVGSHVVLGEIF